MDSTIAAYALIPNQAPHDTGTKVLKMRRRHQQRGVRHGALEANLQSPVLRQRLPSHKNFLRQALFRGDELSHTYYPNVHSGFGASKVILILFFDPS